MDIKAMFGNAEFLQKKNAAASDFSILYSSFELKEGYTSVVCRALGLGFFRLFINGKCVNPDGFLPISSNFEFRDKPQVEVLTGKRIYVPELDVTEFVHTGKNELAIHYGGGWYTYAYNYFGTPRVIYAVLVDGNIEHVSSVSDRIGNSFVTDYCLTNHETHDYSTFDTEHREEPEIAQKLDTEYMFTDCPSDTRIREITPEKIYEDAEKTVYDAKQNIAGYAEIKVSAPKGATVKVRMSEERLSSGALDPKYIHKQEFTVTSDGTVRICRPEFTWFGFRYFEISGEAEPVTVAVIHANVNTVSTFRSDNETLNWIHDTFVHTMLSNLHTGHPSDCPHLERLGYTGDGQLTANATMYTIGVKELYRKWLADIADCQDTLSGHIPYTAPYCWAGGGPGGWGSAIVEVPWQFYRHYGELEILEKYYPAMKRYIDYLDAHSHGEIVTSDQPKQWCLGDWCTPYDGPEGFLAERQQHIVMPPAYVNTYFKIKSMRNIAKIAKILGKDEESEFYTKRADTTFEHFNAIYFDIYNRNYFNNIHGANAFAIDVGHNDERTTKALVDYYTRLGYLDTGIFGTDIVPRVLFEQGFGKLAVDLLTSDKELSYENWRRLGATTVWEYWHNGYDRSHSHPMFGAPTAYLFEYLLGIKQNEDSAGFTAVTISPVITDKISRLSGSILTPRGKISVSYVKDSGEIRFSITVPEGTDARFTLGEYGHRLSAGENEFTVKI